MPRDKGYVMRSGSSFLLLPFPGPVVHVILLFILTLFNGCLTLFSLYLLAVFLVWTVQGYPFAGPALLSLGVVLCAGSFSILCISLLRLRRNTGNTALSTDMDQNTSEEVQHA